MLHSVPNTDLTRQQQLDFAYKLKIRGIEDRLHSVKRNQKLNPEFVPSFRVYVRFNKGQLLFNNVQGPPLFLFGQLNYTWRYVWHGFVYSTHQFWSSVGLSASLQFQFLRNSRLFSFKFKITLTILNSYILVQPPPYLSTQPTTI